jgi:hypothetical protein
VAFYDDGMCDQSPAPLSTTRSFADGVEDLVAPDQVHEHLTVEQYELLISGR